MALMGFSALCVRYKPQCCKTSESIGARNNNICASRAPCCVSRRKILKNGLALSSVFFPQLSAKGEDELHLNKLGAYKELFNTERLFADAMENDMRIYEDRIAFRKASLFRNRVPPGAAVLDIGIGTGPNLKYLPRNCKIVGLEPNKYMWPYSQEKARQLGISLTIEDAHAENIPMPDASFDMVISTLTLCSVLSPATVMDEIGRVLKPGGHFVFVEHTIAIPAEPILRMAQTVFNPLQRAVSDGCNVNRDTENLIRSKGELLFDQIEIDNFKAEFGTPLDAISLVRPHISGFARRSQRYA